MWRAPRHAGFALVAVASLTGGAASLGAIGVVASSTARIDVSKTTVGVTIDREQLENLPINSRRFDELALLVPKVPAGGVQAGHLPENWTFDPGKLRASGPAISGGNFRFDFPVGWKPPANLGLKGYYGGKLEFKLRVPVTLQPPIQVDTDLGRWLDLPRTVQLGSQVWLSGRRNKMGVDVDWTISAFDVGRVEVLTGSTSSVYGSDATAGTVCQITGRPFGASTGDQPAGGITYKDLEPAWNRNLTENWGLVASYYPSRIRLNVEGQNVFGETLVRGDWTPYVTPPCHHPPARPQFNGVTEVVGSQGSLCVCGQVSDLGHWQGLGIGGLSLGSPITATSTSAIFLPPAGLGAGSYPLTYDPWGAGSGTGLSTSFIEVKGKMDATVLRRGGTTPLTLEIIGTDRIFPVILTNVTPLNAELEGGQRQELSTSGGAPNLVRRLVTGKTEGGVLIDWEVALPTCPCDATNLQIAEQAGEEFVKFVVGYQMEFAGHLIDDSQTQFQATGVEQPTLPSSEVFAPGAEPTYKSELLGGVEFEMPRTVSFGVRYIHRSMPRVLEDLDCRDTWQLNLGTDDRYRVQLDWGAAAGQPSGACRSTTQPDSGLFYFSNPDNQELLVKVLNGCSFNNRYWVFASGLTNVEYKLNVTDAKSGQTKTYSPPAGQAFQPIVDTQAFATCP